MNNVFRIFNGRSLDAATAKSRLQFFYIKKIADSSDLCRPERVFWREGSPSSGMVPVCGDPSRQKTRSGRRGSGNYCH